MLVPKARVERPKMAVRKASDVTPEMLELAVIIAQQSGPKLRWTEFWDRLDGSLLEDGSVIDLGDQYGTEAMHHIKYHVKHHEELS